MAKIFLGQRIFLFGIILVYSNGLVLDKNARIVKQSKREADYSKDQPKDQQLLSSMNSLLSKLTQKVSALESNMSALNSNLNNLETSTSDLRKQLDYGMPTSTWIDSDSEDYSFDLATYKGGCHMLGKLWGKVKSVETHGKCVRLFRYSSCEGWSLAFYPGSQINPLNINSVLYPVHSIGPCPAEEFQNCFFKDRTHHRVVKKTSDVTNYFPDLVEFRNITKEQNGTIISSSKFSVWDYLLGPNNRIQFLKARIYRKHVNISQSSYNMADSEYFKTLEKVPTDVVGYGIPPSLGGPVGKTYNVFPMSLSAKEQWTRLTSAIHSFLETGENEMVVVSLNFMYEEEHNSRPYAFYYWMKYVGGNRGGPDTVSYGRVLN